MFAVLGKRAIIPANRTAHLLKIPVDSSELTRIPINTVDLDASDGKKVLKLMQLLDDHDDVQSVSSNFNIPDEILAEMENE